MCDEGDAAWGDVRGTSQDLVQPTERGTHHSLRTAGSLTWAVSSTQSIWTSFLFSDPIKTIKHHLLCLMVCEVSIPLVTTYSLATTQKSFLIFPICNWIIVDQPEENHLSDWWKLLVPKSHISTYSLFCFGVRLDIYYFPGLYCVANTKLKNRIQTTFSIKHHKKLKCQIVLGFTFFLLFLNSFQIFKHKPHIG